MSTLRGEKQKSEEIWSPGYCTVLATISTFFTLPGSCYHHFSVMIIPLALSDILSHGISSPRLLALPGSHWSSQVHMAHPFIHRTIPNCDPLILVFLLHVVQAPISPRAFSSKNITRYPANKSLAVAFLPSLQFLLSCADLRRHHHRVPAIFL